MRYRFIRSHTGEFRVDRMCRVLGVSRGGYYGWLRRPAPLRVREDRHLVVHIRAVHRESRERYGSPRIHAELKAQGQPCGRHRIARLMRREGLQARCRRRSRSTTDSAHAYPVASNHLGRQFEVSAPDRAWVGDITYIPTREGWLYLAVLMDLCSRKVVGWAVSEWINRELPLRALKEACLQRQPKAGLLHHSDRGSVYACAEYREELQRRGFTASMSRRGNCYDNAPAESFFSTLKAELVKQRIFATRREATAEIFEYIEIFYNRRRRHSALGYVSPVVFENQLTTGGAPAGRSRRFRRTTGLKKHPVEKGCRDQA